MPHILIADDDPGIRAGLVAICMAGGHRTSEAGTGAETVRKATAERPDLVLLDLRMPEGDGLEILPRLTALDDAPAVVILTGHADVETAVRAMALGAVNVLEKPVDPPRLRQALERVLSNRTIREERDRLREEVAQLRSGPIVGRSAAIQRVLEHIARVAATPRSTALITGESGVGKELVARAVHDQSARADGPFIPLNCAALADGLLEAELFGYEPGAFTGGLPKGRDGLIAAAKGGTLFLDELGELDLGLQAKLLRVLQERTYRRVGGTLPLAMDARVVASTNRDLMQMVEAGTFREDLFYRLNVFSIVVPPLRARPEDIGPLAHHFLEHFGDELARPYTGFATAAIRSLETHPWPGNIRELRNAVERAAIMTSGGEIPAAHVGLGAPGSTHAPTETAPDAAGASAGPTGQGNPLSPSVEDEPEIDTLSEADLSLERMEAAMIRRALSVTRGNKGRAARALGIHRSTLYKKLELYGIE
ncbi:Transcriptional regulatory protein ZraR [Planctomycetes bacterium Poly30]|uniref:Transcriptional regulatory protein ZraR n=1 Tax=Saltatorellus ferox TaxID=2528018 RepID=A0A518ELN1_9BACT|nr:Transcriptional regulatory protein ZraR [Planctomycetes bacterium Poly30]